MEKISFTITTYCDSKAPFRNCRESSRRKNIPTCNQGVLIMRKKNVMDWLRAMLSMVFYIGLFGGIGYLIQTMIL